MAIPPDALKSVIASLQLNNYAALIIMTAVGYDYFLTLLDEVEYIWAKHWTWVSTLYVFVRYAGLCNIIFISLGGSTFMVGITQLYVTSLSSSLKFHSLIQHLLNRQCMIISAISRWMSVLFLGSADLVMILRVWCMYGRSRLILGILLVSFFLEMITSIVIIGMSDNTKFLEMTSMQILDRSFCNSRWIKPLQITLGTLQMTHGAVMCILAIAQFVRQSLEMYRATKKWEINQYMNLLVRQGILYFLAIYLIIIIQTFFNLNKSPVAGPSLILLLIMGCVPAFTLAPRFTLSIRKMYAHNVSGSGIDTGFGLSSSDASEATMVFVGDERNKDPGGIEGIPVEGTSPA